MRVVGSIGCLFLLWVMPVVAQRDTMSFIAMSYNVENLFDCRHDSAKADTEFTPDSDYRWTPGRYRQKLSGVAQVVMAAGNVDEAPSLVALCEVENDSVLTALTRYTQLRRIGYRYLMTDSPDARGIDVALLYQPRLFRPVDVERISVSPLPGGRLTRDVLHVAGRLISGDTLDVVIVHAPSRSGGADVSEPRRLHVARRIRRLADSLMNVRQRPAFLLMGDLNDYPDNRSVNQVLAAAPPPAETDSLRDGQLYHLLARRTLSTPDYGSYRYQGEWGLLDHLIVNGRLLRPECSLYVDESRAEVFSPDFLLEDDLTHGGRKPWRTYLGPRYLGGYSDHLPVRATFRLTY